MTEKTSNTASFHRKVHYRNHNSPSLDPTLIYPNKIHNGLRYSGLLHSEYWLLLTDVSEQHVSPIFMEQTDRSPNAWTIQTEPINRPEMTVKKYQA